MRKPFRRQNRHDRRFWSIMPESCNARGPESARQMILQRSQPQGSARVPCSRMNSEPPPPAQETKPESADTEEATRQQSLSGFQRQRRSFTVQTRAIYFIHLQNRISGGTPKAGSSSVITIPYDLPGFGLRRPTQQPCCLCVLVALVVLG